MEFLAKNGVVFTNAFSNGPQCSPARSSLISGCYGTTYGNDNHRGTHLVPSTYFWPQYLRNAGYFTVNCGKTDYNITNEMANEYYGITWDATSNFGKDKDKVLSYNSAERGDKPFYAQFNNHTTHMSRITTVSVKNRTLPLTVDPTQVELPPHVPNLPDVRADYALHLEGIRDADKWVGIFIDDLKKKGLLENTIIFFFSDHGGCLPRGKGYSYSTSFKPALIIYAPEKWQSLLPSKPGTKCDRLVEFADFGPTLLSVAGVKPPEHLQGKPFMGKFAEKPRKYAFNFKTNSGENYDPSRAAFDGRYEYVRFYTPYKVEGTRQSFQWGMPANITWDSLYHFGNNCPVELLQHFAPRDYFEALFDTKTDPYCMKNVSGEKKYESVLMKMRKAVSAHIRETKDLGFFPEDVRQDFVKNGIVHYNWVRENHYDFQNFYTLIEKASEGNIKDIAMFTKYLSHERAEFRFWAASGFAEAGKNGFKGNLPERLYELANDEFESVSAVAAEALVLCGKTDDGLKALGEQAKAGNSYALIAIEELGKKAEPVLPVIRQLLKGGKGNQFQIKSILINFGEYDIHKLYTKSQTEGYIRNYEDRVLNWAPVKP